jgi:hypothetical protein
MDMNRVTRRRPRLSATSFSFLFIAFAITTVAAKDAGLRSLFAVPMIEQNGRIVFSSSHF